MTLHLGILVLSFLLRMIGTFTGSRFGSFLLGIGATIFLIISVIRVWKGEPHQIGPLEEPTRWLDEKIRPRK